MTDPTVQRLRDEISALDRSILDAVEQAYRPRRGAEASQAGGRASVPRPRARAALLDDLVSANSGPLSDEGVGELFRELLDLTKREVAGEDDAAASA